jgi:EAL domain-containing protein (putative c-di-GMP-specific phosphodiesterase class I)
VETETQLQILKNLGCTLVQGYYFSRPLHPAEFETEFLNNSETKA